MSDAAADDGGWLLAGPTAPDAVQRYYDDWVDQYDATLAAWGYDAPERAAALLIQSLGGVPSHDATTVLDAGCGTGLAGAALRAAGFGGRLLGVDLSPASLEHATVRATYDKLDVADLQQGLALADRAVDALLCVGVLTYVPDTRAIWREFARIVAPGGVIVCTQRSDVWADRRCNHVLDELERDGTWTVLHLSPPLDYMPGNADFGHAIGVRYLAARTRTRR